MIDFSDVLHDTELGAVALTRIRIDQTVSGRGRAIDAETSTTFVGIVTQDAGQIAERVPDGEYVSGSILVTTDTPLRMAGATVEADCIVWSGMRFTVKALSPYAVHGVYEAVCSPDGVGL